MKPPPEFWYLLGMAIVILCVYGGNALLNVSH